MLGKGTQRHSDQKKDNDRRECRESTAQWCAECGCPGCRCRCYEVQPIHKFNGGSGATICNGCRVVISRGHIDVLFCDDCRGGRK